ncbi:MAG: HAD-IIIA family hydrolase [bacterium]|nr:HAD-IIIA family hydrolase [bacterium]
MLQKQAILICADRDGTINLDENFYLGSKPHWKSQLEFLPGVVEGIKLLNRIPNTKFVIVTNQAGIALEGDEFLSLTEERGHEVNQHIVDELTKLGCRVDGYQLCPYVTSAYAKKAADKGRVVAPRYIKDDARCLKPNIGMLEDAATMFGEKLENIKKKFVIGDRATDIEMGIRGNCTSVLIESFKTRELGDVEKVLAMQKDAPPGDILLVADFLEAARYIENLCHE